MSVDAQGDPWSQLKAAFRSACSRRIAGDQAEAVRVLRDEVPGLVSVWAKTSDLNPAEKKQRLKGLFEDESDRAEEMATIFELFAGKFESMLATQVAQQVLDEIRPELEQIVSDVMAKLPAIQETAPHGQAVGQAEAASEVESEAEVGIEPEREVPELPTETRPPEIEDEVESEAEVGIEPEQEVPDSPTEMRPPESHPLPIPAPQFEETPEHGVTSPPLAESMESAASGTPPGLDTTASEPEIEADEMAEPASVSDGTDHEPFEESIQMTPDSVTESQPEDSGEVPEDSKEQGQPEDNDRSGRISFDDIEGLIDHILDET